MTPLSFIIRRVGGLFAMGSIALATGAFAAGLGNIGSGTGRGGGGLGGLRSGGSGAAGLEGGEEASGLGVFSRFPFRVTVALQEGYDDNVFTRSFVQQGSAFTNASLGAEYQFGSPRTQISANFGGGLTYYYDRPQQSGPDYNAFLDLRLTHRFTARLSLEISAYTTYQTEPDFSLDIGINRRSGNYFYTSDRIKLNYQFTPRFSIETSYTILSLIYDNSVVGTLQNRIENTFGNEFRYLLLPTTTLVGEYRIAFVDYMDADASAITHHFLAGFNQSFSPRFNANFRGGVQLREFESNISNRTNSERISPDLEATISYRLGERSDITWVNRYGIQEGEGSSNDTSSTSYRTGLNVKYDLTPRITSGLSFYYNHNSFDSGAGSANGFDEDSIDVALSLRYAVTRYLGIQASYNHAEVFSSRAIGRDYSRNRISGGIDFVF